MPYITVNRRIEIQEGAPAVTAGELNYVLTRAVIAYMKTHGLSYQTINDINGALDGAKSEFYRRVAVPYENGKIINNGDVYP